MKRFIAAILCVGLIAAVTAGCGYKDALSKENKATQATEATGSSATADEPKPADFKDNLEGLISYFTELEYLAMKDGKLDESNVTVMDASLIGAKEGKKFITAYGGKAITIELYEYDLKNLNDTAKTVVESVKNSGEFTILDLPSVKAYLSDDEKYLLIYTDSSIDDEKPDENSDNYKHREEVIENFRKF